MNQQEFQASMARILSFHNAPRTPLEAENLNNYLASLFEAVGRMDSYTFERVTKELATNMGRGQKPMPSQFWAIFHRLKGEEAVKILHSCDSCKSTGWVYVHMIHPKLGIEDDFARPCPDCRKKHPYQEAETRDGWIIEDRKAAGHEADMIAQAKRLKPQGAAFVLDLIDRCKVKFPDAVLAVLVECSAPPLDPAEQPVDWDSEEAA